MAEEPFSMEPCVCLQARKADRHLTRIYDLFLRPGGMRITQFGLLACIANLDEPSITGIGQALSMDQTTVTRNVMKLESRGLVETILNPGIGNRKIVTLTETGRKALRDSQKAWEEAQDYVRDCLGEADYNLLLRLVERLTSIPEKMNTHGSLNVD